MPSGPVLSSTVAMAANLRLLFLHSRNDMLADMDLQSLIIGILVGVAGLFFAAAIVLMAVSAAERIVPHLSAAVYPHQSTKRVSGRSRGCVRWCLFTTKPTRAIGLGTAGA